jgi:hypothetical protein
MPRLAAVPRCTLHPARLELALLDAQVARELLALRSCWRGCASRLAADANVESEEQKRPQQDRCNCGQHPAHGLK